MYNLESWKITFDQVYACYSLFMGLKPYLELFYYSNFEYTKKKLGVKLSYVDVSRYRYNKYAYNDNDFILYNQK